MAELLALSKSDHGVSGSNPADGEILSEAKPAALHCTGYFMFTLLLS